VAMPTVDLAGFVYRGEGNANLVVALPRSGLVLRFPKSKYNDKSQCDKLETICRYINQVLRPELGSLVADVRIVRVDWAQFQLVRRAVTPARPACRLGKDIHYPAALLMPDCALRRPPGSSPSSPLVAVEVKPKLGLATDPGALCNFCMKQHYKVAVGEVGAVSRYCPLDLYSGDQARMLRAAASLLATPQNNLRLLCDGMPVDPATCHPAVAALLGSMDLLAPALVACLLHQPGHPSALPTAAPAPPLAPKRRACAPPGRRPPAGSVLERVLGLQGRGALGDREALALVRALVEEGRQVAELQEEVVGAADPGPRLRPLRDYLLSVTARDLSLILTLATAADQARPAAPALRVAGAWLVFQWHVIDLDPKSLNRISKYVEQRKLWREAAQGP